MKIKKKTYRKTSRTKTIPVRLSSEALNEIDSVATELDMSRSDVIRFSAKIGLNHLKRIECRLEDAVLEFTKAVELK